VGDAFEGRGELAILGLHVKLMKGIDARWVVYKSKNEGQTNDIAHS
jgi:hypothetical protein